MPKFMKDVAVSLLDGGIESYLLGLYGMTIPAIRPRRKQDTQYAPVMGLFGAATELLIKACLVQAKGVSSMYQNGDTVSGVYRFGSEVLEELRREIKDATNCISFIWKTPDNFSEQQAMFAFYLDKFKLLQGLRANGLHAGIGCSRDIAVATANEIHQFIALLSQGKKLNAYLKNIPAPEATIKDREAIFEDLTRRMNASKENNDKLAYLRNMYLVLPYIPEIEPDWIKTFDRSSLIPPCIDDINYLVKTLSDAHSIYLLKNRGGKDGIPVRVEPNNPNALPISIQNIKRELSSIPDVFNNDILTANTRLAQNRLDLPIDDFLVDLYLLGLDNSSVLTSPQKKLTAQQTWPFVAAAYSTQGSPRPCWFFIQACNEQEKLISYLQQVKDIGNGYFIRRIDTVIKMISALCDGNDFFIGTKNDSVFNDILPFVNVQKSLSRPHPFTPSFIKQFPLGEKVSVIVHEFITGSQKAGDTLASILKLESLNSNEKKTAIKLIPYCAEYDNRNGLVAVLRTSHLQNYHSYARKIMFFCDIVKDGPNIRVPG